jgi:hypothetical protein
MDPDLENVILQARPDMKPSEALTAVNLVR